VRHPWIELDACRRVLALLSDYLDDDLAPEDRAAAEAHLAACGACACTAAELAATIEALRGLRAGAASRGSRTRAATTWRSTAPPSPGRSRPSSS
jgi:anti-sigma factor RsiW